MEVDRTVWQTFYELYAEVNCTAIRPPFHIPEKSIPSEMQRKKDICLSFIHSITEQSMLFQKSKKCLITSVARL